VGKPLRGLLSPWIVAAALGAASGTESSAGENFSGTSETASTTTLSSTSEAEQPSFIGSSPSDPDLSDIDPMGASSALRLESIRGDHPARAEFQHDQSVEPGPTGTFVSLQGRWTHEQAWAMRWESKTSHEGTGPRGENANGEPPSLGASSFTLTRSFGNDAFVSAGRHHREALTGTGNIDGVHAEVSLGGRVRAGVVGGFRPGEDEEEFSAEEPLTVGYLSAEASEPEMFHYGGSVGVLGSSHRGKPERLAILVNQRVDLGESLTLRSSSEMDIGVQAYEGQTGLQITRGNFEAALPVVPALTLHAGFDHHVSPGVVPRNHPEFQRARQRYWSRGVQHLFWNLHVAEEISLLDAPARESDPTWRVSLTRRGFSTMKQAQFTAAAYNLEESEGYGGTVVQSVSLLRQSLSLRPSIAFFFFEPDLAQKDFRITEAALHAQLEGPETLKIRMGGSYPFAEVVDRTVVDFSVHYSW